MRDEDLREVQREARLEEGLAVLIECLRNGHKPITDKYGCVLSLSLMVPGAVSMGRIEVCRNCRLTYWALPATEWCAKDDRQAAAICGYAGTCQACTGGERR